MNSIPGMRSTRLLVALVGLALLASCGGGGGGGSGGGSPELISITAQGVAAALWEAPGITPPFCPTNLPLNAPVIFTFAGRVDAASLPPQGPAVGSINITVPGVGGAPTLPAFGGFAVQDDPSMPPGNGRRVVFTPIPPADPTNPQTAGFQQLSTYQVSVPRGGTSAQVITVNGNPLQTEAVTCFTTCTPPAGQSASVCFTDPVPGNPFIIETFPPSDDPAPTAFDPTTLVPGSGTNPFATQPNTVTIFISEPLFPENIDLANVRLVLDSGATPIQVAGQVQFFQAGSLEAGPDRSRIDYIASSPLLASATYKIELSSLVRDFGDNGVEQFPASAPGERTLQTVDVPFCPQPALIEEFDNTANLAMVSDPPVAIWANTGQVTTTFPEGIVGTGAFGPLAFGPGNHSLDTGMPNSTIGGLTAFEDGAWHTSMVQVDMGATVRVSGPFPAHLRSIGTITINGVLNASGGDDPSQAPGSPNQGPRQGQVENGSPNFPATVFGGVGGPGAGKGGDASQGDVARTMQGESGLGASLDDGSPNTGTISGLDTFGGGEGGEAGFFPPSQAGETGGLGGAGGSAWQTGASGQPENPILACAPLTTVPQDIALPTGVPLSFMPPLGAAIGIRGGSGGGGGGDHLEMGGVAFDDQGGAGGGGGGGLRMSCIGALTIGPTAVISCNGITGNLPAIFAGAGGGGSGGQIWCQSFSNIVTDTMASMFVGAGSTAMPCSRQLGGAGGPGLFQFEDTSMAGPNTNFIGSADQGGLNISTPAFPFGATVGGSVTSEFFDTGYGDPRYTSATQNTEIPGNVSLGDAPGASLDIFYEGAPESVFAPGTPDLSLVSAPVTGANIAQLNGFRYVRFRVEVSYPSPPSTLVTNTLPTLQRIEIQYDAPINCP